MIHASIRTFILDGCYFGYSFISKQDSQVLMRDTMEFVREVLAKYRDSLVLVSREDTREKRSELKGALTKVCFMRVIQVMNLKKISNKLQFV